MNSWNVQRQFGFASCDSSRCELRGHTRHPLWHPVLQVSVTSVLQIAEAKMFSFTLKLLRTWRRMVGFRLDLYIWRFPIQGGTPKQTILKLNFP